MAPQIEAQTEYLHQTGWYLQDIWLTTMQG